MPGLSELLGISMPGEAASDAGVVSPETGAGWDSALKDPVFKSALLGFGMQLMTGGWGSPVQQAGQALGAGASSAAGTAKSINDFQGEERARTDKLSEGSANRKQSETNARIGADSRAEVANIRSQAMLERTTMNLNKAAPAMGLKYRTEARKVYEGNLQNMSKDQASREAEIEQLAAQMYSADSARGTAGGAGATSQTGAPVAGEGTPGGQGPATKGPESTSKAGQPTPSLDKLMSDPKNGPKVKEMMGTPEGQADLISRNPALKEQIDTYNRRQSQQPYAPHNLLRGLFGAEAK